MQNRNKQSIIIVGGGPSAMMLACTLDPNIFKVTIIEKGKAIGRKFLVAGKGGFNLTHSEDIIEMVKKYEGPSFLKEALLSFTNEDLREWFLKIGIETYVGSSKRVFPIKGIKPIEVLEAIKTEMRQRNVKILTESKWSGTFIEDGHISIITKGENVTIEADKLVFAMGGASWNVTGSDGNWISNFAQKKIKTIPFRSSNCTLKINWGAGMADHIGKPVKNIALTYKEHTIKGELMITQKGIEGSPAYALSYYVGKKLEKEKSVEVLVDLKPTFDVEKIRSILQIKNKNTSKLLREDLMLSSNTIALLKCFTTREEFSDINVLSQKIKKLALPIIGIGNIDEAISTVGGIHESAIKSNMELIDFHNHFVVGEMIDWNGPTGGYLLQACFSMGRKLGLKLNTGVRHKK